MPKRDFDEIDNWAGGANTAATADTLPTGKGIPSQFPRGYNTAFTDIAPGTAKISKRRGSSEALTAPLSGEPTIIGQYYLERSGGTRFHVLVCGDGSIRLRNSNGTSSTLATGVFSVSDLVLPCFAVANDWLFITIGATAVKTDGTSVYPFGISKPTAPSAVQGAAGSMAAGTYDILLTYRNVMDSESQRSDMVTVTIAASRKIDVSWSAPAAAQVTHVRVYIRQQSRGPNFYRAVAGASPAPDAVIGGYPVATTSCTLDITNAMFDNFIILPPAVNEGFPPPTGCSSPTWHNSRMFVHDGASIFWSDVERPEAFNPAKSYEPVNPDDGAQLVALASASNDQLVLLKEKSSHVLNGKLPSSWAVDVLDPFIGTVNQQCVVKAGRLYWWDRFKGPVSYGGTGKPELVGLPKMGPAFKPEAFKQDSLNLMCGVFDDSPQRQRVMWALPDDLIKARNTIIFPYNTLLGEWESVGWNPFDVASMAVAKDSTATPWVFIGGYKGKLFQFWNAANDGVPLNNTARGKVFSSTNNTLTCLKADGTLPTWTASGLKQLYVYAISSDGLDIQRRLINDNASNVLTLDSNWSINPNDAYTWVIGGIDFQIDTPWMLSDAPFYKKRFEHFHVQAKSPTTNIPITVDMFFSYNILDASVLSTLLLSGAAVYAGDAGPGPLYDVARYASTVQDDAKIRVSRAGFAWRARLRNIYPDEELTILRLAMRTVLLNTNR